MHFPVSSLVVGFLIWLVNVNFYACSFIGWKKSSRIVTYVSRRWITTVWDMQGYSFDKQVKIVIATMTLHNYIRRHAHGDRHFVRSEEREGYGSSGEIEMDDDVEEEYHGHGAQEMEAIRNSITQSLMNARNNVNI